MKALRILSLTAAVVGLAVAGRAGPVLFIYDQDTGDSLEIADNALGLDLDMTDGIIAWSGELPDNYDFYGDGSPSPSEWGINYVTGVVSGSRATPTVELSVDATSNGDLGTSTLGVYLFASGFGPSAGLNAALLFSGATAGLSSYFLYQDNANGDSLSTFDFAAENWLASGSAFGTGSVWLNGPADLYSLALGVQLDHGGGVETSVASLKVSVPDQGVTALLLAMGLLGLGVASRRRLA